MEDIHLLEPTEVERLRELCNHRNHAPIKQMLPLLTACC
jgi:hypothetical protein